MNKDVRGQLTERGVAAVTLSFDTRGRGIEIVDAIERRQIRLEAADADLTDAETDAFVYPVQEAVSLRTSELRVPEHRGAQHIDDTGELLGDLTVEDTNADGTLEVPAGTHFFDVADEIKVYLRVETTEPFSVGIRRNPDEIRFDFGQETTVQIGARSYHEHPEATITTTDDPEDLMTAVSYLGSAMTDWSAMRSYKTFRGHPPEIELGQELDVPDVLERPETGVTIELPPEREYVYAAAPTAFYLGAAVVPGNRPRIVTDQGFEHALDTHRGVAGELERVLKQAFMLDCVVRTAAPYSSDTTEAEELREHLPVAVDELYDQPVAEQLDAYLSVPFELVEPSVERWTTAAHVAPTPENAELLPHLVDELSVIHPPSARETDASAADLASLESMLTDETFTRSSAARSSGDADTGPSAGPAVGPDSPAGPSVDADAAGASAGAAGTAFDEDSVVDPETLDAARQLWAAPGVPVGAGKPTRDAYRNRLLREPVDPPLEAIVVCNDDSMAVEDDAVRQLLGGGRGIDLEIRPFKELLVDELRALLERGADFFHYVGHIDDDGFACVDGHLDARDLDSVDVDAFFLNACTSYEQGQALLDAGASAGIVTLTDVFNGDAVDIGRTTAQLLDRGFPLWGALEIAQHAFENAGSYTVVGDSGLTVTQAGGVPAAAYVEDAGDEFRVRMTPFVPTDGSGTTAVPPLAGDGVARQLLREYEWTADEATLATHLDSDTPVFYDGELFIDESPFDA